MRSALLWCLAMPLATTAHAQAHPLVGHWTLRIPTGVRGAEGSPVMVNRGGDLAVDVVGDSLIATMTLASVADVPSKSMRMAARRRDGRVAFSYTSDARLTNGSDERSVRATSTYVLEAIGDSLAGLLSQEVPGISGVPDRSFSGTRVVRPAPTTGLALLAQMRATYDGAWFTSLRFTQKTTTRAPNGAEQVTTWYESVRSTPSGTQLRIDVGDPANGEGVLYTADSLWVVRGGKQVAARAGGNTILPLIQSVYVQPVERTVADLKTTGVDLARPLVAGEWQGKPVWVVGAKAPADTLSPQFWVEQQTLAVVRAIFSPVAGAPVMDMRFDALVPLAGGWLATRCTFYVGGAVQQTEEYQDWQANVTLAPELFSTATWTTAPHWAKSSREIRPLQQVSLELNRAPAIGAPVHPLVGAWDVNVVAAGKNEPDGTVTPVMSTGIFTFAMDGDSLVLSMQVALSPSRAPIRLVSAATSDTATFTRSAQALNAVKGEQNVLSAVPSTSVYQFVAVGDSLKGSMRVTTNGRTNMWPITGTRRSTP